MSKTNSVRLIGNIGNNINAAQTRSGLPVCNFSFATHERVKNEQGQAETITEWHNVVCFSSLASLVTTHCSKGTKLMIEGRLKTRTYVDSANVQRYVTEIICEEVLFLDAKKQ
jgi:single-strand DNA-binding protein